MKNNLNLNEKHGSYSCELTNNLNTIFSMYEDRNLNTEQFRQAILDIVAKANDTPAKRNFVNNLVGKRTKDDLVMYVSNVTLRAAHMSANVDDRWATEK